MNNLVQTARLIAKIPWGYGLFKRAGFPRFLPTNVVFVTTYKCNCRCQTCNIWETYIKNPEESNEELTLKEYERIFENIGKPYWVTMGGGEPFLRNDIDQLVISLYKIAQPVIVNIPSNASLPEVIFIKVKNILKECPKIRLILNLSLDHIGSQNDQIRGKQNSFNLFLETVKRLKEIKQNNFTLGVHTVISEYNYQDFTRIYDYVNNSLAPDSFIIENAQKRHEFMNYECEIFCENDKLIKVIDFFMSQIPKSKSKKIGKLIKAFRMSYYGSLKHFLRCGRMPYQCFAGVCSCQIDPLGGVQACAVKNYFMGNLRKNNYNFKELWRGLEAQKARKAIKAENCSCTLANVSYANMLMDARAVGRIVYNLLKFK